MRVHLPGRALFAVLLLLFFYNSSNAQIIFTEDFDGIPGPTSGGAGTYAFPSGWLLFNLDNRTPDAQVAYVNQAWERREDFNFNVGDSAAFSTSYYSPVGPADDWMITPLIGPLPANTSLKWKAVTYDPSYQDGYEVRIFTGPTAPVQGNLLMNSTVIYSTTAAASTWHDLSVNLNSYTGQSVYIAFRNNSNDKFLLLIDDIILQVEAFHDAQIIAVDTISPYTQVPVSQSTSLPLDLTIRNNGIHSITNVRAIAEVYLDGILQTTLQSPVQPSISAGATADFSIPPFTPTAIGNYTFRFYSQLAESDQNPANDTTFRELIVTPATYSRNKGPVSGSLGIGYGNGYMGSSFTFPSAFNLDHVDVYFTRGYTGRPAAMAVWNFQSGYPNNIILYSDTVYYPDDSARTYSFTFNGQQQLLPGEYAFTVIEMDSTLSIGLTDEIFTENTQWVDWSANPVSPWGNNEDYGLQFRKSYAINPVECNLIVNAPLVQQPSCGLSNGSITLNAVASSDITYSWSNGSTGSFIDNLPSGTYTYTVSTDACSITDSVSLQDTIVNLTDADQPVITGNTNVCEGDEVILTIASGNLNDATDWVWYVNSCGGVPLDSGLTITVNPSSTTTYYARGEGVCAGNGICGEITVNVNTAIPFYADMDNDGYGDPLVSVNACEAPADYVSDNTDCDDTNGQVYLQAPEICDGVDNDCNGFIDDGTGGPAPVSIIGNTDQCVPLAFGSAVYSVAPVPGATSYNWNIPSDLILLSGQGTSSITVAWTTQAVHTGILGDICVNAVSGCGISENLCTSISIQISAPVTPPSISGPARVCPGDQPLYSVALVARANTYNWTFPAGMNITSGQGDNIVYTEVLPGYSGGTLILSASNACGMSQWRQKTLSIGVPNSPGPISGPVSGVCGLTSVQYSIAAVPFANSYEWTVSGTGASITGPSNNNSVLIDFSNTAGTVTLTVKAINNCGSGNSRSITIFTKPARPDVITGQVSVCPSLTYEYSIPVVAGTQNYQWTVPAGSSISGQGTKTIQNTYGASQLTSQVISVTAINSCGASQSRSLTGINVLNVNCAKIGDIDSGFNLYPNPASATVTCEIQSAVHTNADLRITDVSGRILYLDTYSLSAGSNTIELNTHEYSRGVYILEIVTPGNKYFNKLILE